jgi:hypothetical protein
MSERGCDGDGAVVRPVWVENLIPDRLVGIRFIVGDHRGLVPVAKLSPNLPIQD